MISSLNPKVIFEIGVGNPYICRTIPFMGSDVSLELFEPNPATFAALKHQFGGRPNVKIHNVAIFDRDGEIDFADDGDSSFVAEVRSPTVNNAPTEYTESRARLKVPCRKLSNYDYGQIDVALIDTEGSEWRIIKDMVSRPKLLVLETHDQAKYQTPDLDKIREWMRTNGYREVRREVTDTWFLRNDISLSL